MRKEKQEELNSYVEEMKVIKKIPSTNSNNFIKVERNNYILNHGRTLERETIKKKDQKGEFTDGNATIIVPITKDGELVLTVESRVNTKETVGVGFPAGYLEEGEDANLAGRRELLEETGYEAEDVKIIGGGYQDEGCAPAYNTFLLATGCVKVSEQALDKDEFIKYFICTIEEAYEMLDNGTIKGNSSQLALYKAMRYIR